MATVPSIGRAAPFEAEATRELYERHAAQVFRYCLHQLGSREEAEDAVQSTFLNAFRGLRRGIVPETEAAWLFKIAHNVCLSRRRSAWRRGRIESPADFELVEELAPAPSRRADELIGLQDVLEGMPEQQRRAILLREWQGLSYREIAEELELSQSAVETLIFRARRSLASGLERPAETAGRRRRSAPAAALANVLSAAQGWLFGGGAAAVKVAATVAVVGAGTVVAAAPIQHRPHHVAPTRATPARKAPASGRHVRDVPTAPAAPAVTRPQAPSTAPAARPVPARPAPARRPHTVVRRRAPAPAPAPAATSPVAAGPAPVQAPPVHTLPATAAPPAQRNAQQHGQQHVQHGRAQAPGQVKKQQPAAAAPAPSTPPVATPPVEPAAPAAPAAPPGNGNGNAYGRDKAHANGPGD